MSDELSARLDTLEAAIQGLASHLFGAEFGHKCWGHDCGGDSEPGSQPPNATEQKRARSASDLKPRRPAKKKSGFGSLADAVGSPVEAAKTRIATMQKYGMSPDQKDLDLVKNHALGIETVMQEFAPGDGHMCWGKPCGSKESKENVAAVDKLIKDHKKTMDDFGPTVLHNPGPNYSAASKAIEKFKESMKAHGALKADQGLRMPANADAGLHKDASVPLEPLLDKAGHSLDAIVKVSNKLNDSGIDRHVLTSELMKTRKPIDDDFLKAAKKADEDLEPVRKQHRDRRDAEDKAAQAAEDRRVARIKERNNRPAGGFL